MNENNFPYADIQNIRGQEGEVKVFTLNEFQELSKRTMPDQFEDLVMVNYALGLTGESGEVADIVKKGIFHGHDLDKEEMLKELGDVLHYLSGLATLCGFTLEQVATANIVKLMRRYPNGFSETASRNRME